MSINPYSNNVLLLLLLFFPCFCINTSISLAAETISGNQTQSGDQATILSSGGNSQPGFFTPADTISADKTVSGNQTIVSSGGNFELGFFTPGKSAKYYIGIWYKKVREQTIVWVANRETPISDTSAAQFKILDGNLVLLNESQTKIWSTDLNPRASNNSVSAILLDDGNLVLRQGLGSNSSSFAQSLWESFDDETNTWMYGAKIGYNKKTKEKRILTSWKSSEDPAPGLFTYEMDPNGSRYFLIWNRTERYWTTGSWNGHTFSLLPEMRLNYLYNFTYVNNENESYFTCWPYDKSVIMRTFVDVSGQIKNMVSFDHKNWSLIWSQPRQQCEVYAYCGPFSVCNPNAVPFCRCLPGFKIKSENDWNLMDFSGGCVRDSDLRCMTNGTISSERKDKFLANPNMRLPEHSQSLMVGSPEECESSCLTNCSCKAYAYDENGCSVWSDDLLNLQQLAEGDGSRRTIYIRISASSSVFSGNKNGHLVVIGAIVGSVASILVLLAIILAVRWRTWRQMIGISRAMKGSLWAFGYKDLQIATKNFSEKLGGGGFGSVYKGTLSDSIVIAVKKLDSINQGEKQFRTEVSTIGTIQHVNLVKLLGFCPKGDKKLLVYEYLENGSLNSHLFNANESRVLEWKTRYQIALGIARGLAYLHEKCRDCIIHCDIKPENILLDAEFCPKVGDFGLAKLVGRDFSRVLTTIRGTRGYLAPEWISGVAITTKVDVYSYGMMLLELISGKRNSEHSEDENAKFFPSVAASVMIDGGDMLGLLDPILNRDADVEEVLKLCKVACWCIQDDENIRPSMGQVVQILEGVIDVSLPPIPRSLQVLLAASPEHIVFFTDSSSVPSPEAKGTTSSASSTPSRTTSSPTN